MVKVLLYCNKTKPKLFNTDQGYVLSDFGIGEYYKNPNLLNGKVILECEYYTEEISFNHLDDDSDNDRKCCGYAIHIKNLKVYDTPKQLSDFETGEWVEYRYGPVYWFPRPIKKVTCGLKTLDVEGNPYYMIPCTSSEIFDIIKGKKTCIIKKKIPEDMRKNLIERKDDILWKI